MPSNLASVWPASAVVPPTTVADNLDPEHSDKVIRSLAPSPMQFVDTQRAHVFQFAVGQAPFHEPLHRAIYGLSAGMEHGGCFSPAQSSCPTGEKTHHATHVKNLRKPKTFSGLVIQETFPAAFSKLSTETQAAGVAWRCACLHKTCRDGPVHLPH
jgi:hypothetical protein